MSGFVMGIDLGTRGARCVIDKKEEPRCESIQETLAC